jgi:hypothetical protein
MLQRERGFDGSARSDGVVLEGDPGVDTAAI